MLAGARQWSSWLLFLLVFGALIVFADWRARLGSSHASINEWVGPHAPGFLSLSKIDGSPLLARVAPAVVNIAVLQPVPALQNPLLRDPRYRPHVVIPSGARPPRIAAGTGVVVDAELGIVVTNFHILRDASAIQVNLADGRHAPAALIAFSSASDLAVLRLRGVKGLSALSLANPAAVGSGEPVMSMGNPFNKDRTVASGIVNGFWRSPAGAADGALRVDININPGNSGGPIINRRGEVIGISSGLVSEFGSDRSGGLAIPASEVQELVGQARRLIGFREGRVASATALQMRYTDRAPSRRNLGAISLPAGSHVDLLFAARLGVARTAKSNLQIFNP